MNDQPELTPEEEAIRERLRRKIERDRDAPADERVQLRPEKWNEPVFVDDQGRPFAVPQRPVREESEETRRANREGLLDRAAGVLLGAACGDALGVPYEFQPRLAEDETPRMAGGGLGPYEPGEYSDDTQMQVVIAKVAATGVDLRSDEALRAIGTGFVEWASRGASDIGAQTRSVLSAAAGSADVLGAMRAASESLHARTGRSAGNGSLMRTSVVALAFLGSDLRQREQMADAATKVSQLTHYDRLAAEACVLWCEGVRRAVLDETFYGVRNGLNLLEPDRAAQWDAWLKEAEAKPPHEFDPNGFVVPAFQAAWSAIMHTPVPENPSDHLWRATAAAVKAGDDTDTVAAIAGALLGARWGASAIPEPWRKAVHGWPGYKAKDLTELARSVVAAHQ